MAMPSGCELTFRYRLKYLAQSVRDHLQNSAIKKGDELLVSYVDQSVNGQPTFFIPVRFATVVEAVAVGDFAVLRMRVQSFAYSEDLDTFNRDIRSRSAEAPDWPTGTSSEYPTGSYWIEVGDYPKSLVASTSIANWQRTVGQLVKRSDFQATGPFYQVVSLTSLSDSHATHLEEGQLTLRPNSEYELQIDHFLPSSTAGDFQLNLLFSGQILSFVTGPTIQIDSPYDRHWIRFKTKEPIQDERAVITIMKKSAGKDAAVEFDMPVLVKGNQSKTILIGTVAGLLLAAPQVITTLNNPSFQDIGRVFGLCTIIVIFNWIVGLIAAFNFRKPIG
jgi:hypothetical protein